MHVLWFQDKHHGRLKRQYNWGEPGQPHIDHDNGPSTRKIRLSVCVCNYYSPAFVAPWFPRPVYALKYSVYSGILTYSRVWFTNACTPRLHSTEQQGQLATRCLPWRLSTNTGRWMHRHMVYTDSTYWDTGAVAARQLQKQPMGCRTVLPFCDVHIHKGATLNLLQCLRVICGYGAVQTNSAEIPLSGIAAYVAILTIQSAQAHPQYSMNALVITLVYHPSCLIASLQAVCVKANVCWCSPTNLFMRISSSSQTLICSTLPAFPSNEASKLSSPSMFTSEDTSVAGRSKS